MAAHRRLRLPDRAHSALETLLNLDQAKADELERAIGSAAPTLGPEDFATAVTSTMGRDKRRFAEVVFLLAQLYVARGSSGLSVADMVDQVCDVMRETGKDTLQPRSGDWGSFKARLARLLNLDQTLGVTAKAIDVMMQHERTYCSARVLTDLRPVFKSNPGEPPEAALIVHTLKIEYHEGDQLKEFFVALDATDVQDLREHLLRAEQKAASLDAILKASGLANLEPSKG